MAMLKDSIITGSLRVTDIVLTDGVQASVIKAPTSSGSTTYGVGSNGQVLKSNGTTVYWGTDDNSTSYVASSQGTGNSGKFLTVNSSGQVVCSNFSDLVTVRNASSLSASGATVTVPAGYYPSQVTKSISNGTVVASVSSNSGGSASMAATGFTALTGSTTSNYYVTLSTSAGSVKAKAAGGTAGYITSSTTNETAATSVAVSGNGTKIYVPTNTITGSVVDLTAPKVAVSGAATGFTALTGTNTSSYYITVSGTGTNGSVKGKATAGGTTGVVAASATNTSAASTITPTITGSGTKIYIPASSHTISAISGGGVSCTFNAATSCSLSTTDTLNSGVSFTFKGSRAAASVSSTATAGYTPASSKTATLAAASANSSTYYIQGVTLTKPTSGIRKFDITVPNGDVTVTFRFEVDEGGNVTIGPPA